MGTALGADERMQLIDHDVVKVRKELGELVRVIYEERLYGFRSDQ